jgi:large subunit ribosomal protein L19
MNPIIEEITAHQIKGDLPAFKVGDGVRVHTKVREGDKERIQIFAGIVIARKGHGIHETFTVRRISYGEGVERVFPVNSPNIERIEIERESVPMRARLYYLRDREGKAAMAVRAKRYDPNAKKGAGAAGAGAGTAAGAGAGAASAGTAAADATAAGAAA